MAVVEAITTTAEVLTEAEVETIEVVTEVVIKVHQAISTNQGLTWHPTWALVKDSNNILNLASLNLCSNPME